MAEKENQHYVPQYYFRFFNGGEQSICLLLRKTGIIRSPAPIRGQASKSYFYGDKEIENQIEEIEKILRPAQIKFRECKSPNDLTLDDRNKLLQGVMFQRSRTMTTRLDRAEAFTRMMQLQLEVSINNDPTKTDKEKEELRSVLGLVQALPEPHQGMIMAISLTLAEHLQDLTLIKIQNRTNRPFIFGDSPVILSNPAQKKILNRGVLGAQTPGILIFFPLGTDQALMLIDESTYTIKGSIRNGIIKLKNLSDLRQLNKLQIHNATSAVYFHDIKYADYVKSLWQETKPKLTNIRGKIYEGPMRVDGREAEVIHTYDQQLPLIPNLTFLKYEEFPADSNFIARRNPFTLF
ncbi:DUF4238 domain-containing protein [Pseudomonas aeruginosa]